MASDLLRSTIASQGSLVRTSWLRERGFARATVDRAVARGAIYRVCAGWVALPTATRASVIAVTTGGKLTGASALSSRGLWDAVDLRTHVLLGPKAYGRPRRPMTPLQTFVAPRFPSTGIVRHWRNEVFPDPSEPAWRASVLDSLLLVARTAPLEQFVACAESALQTRTLSRAGLPELRAALPARLRQHVAALDSRLESGLESIFLFRVRPLGCRIDVQVRIPALARSGREGRVDFVLDGWLVIEVDGDEFHDPATDRIRNSFLVRLGYRWHRFGYHQILGDWAGVEATLVELLRYPPARGRRTI